MFNAELMLRIKKKYRYNYAFAEKVGAYESKISRVIHGRQELPPIEKRKWAAALGAKPSEIFPFES